jgi:hypothetical protein
MRSRVTHVEFPVFSGYIVHVEITSDPTKSLLKYPSTRDLVEEFDDDFGEAFTVHDTDGGISMIFFQHNASVGTIAHEAWHAIKQMMKICDVDLENEVVAYHLGYLVNEIFKFMRGRRRAK